MKHFDHGNQTADSQVLELTSQGYSQRDIASKLQVDLTAVNRDVKFLRDRAQENLRKHISETIPQQYQQSLTGINQVLKMAWEIATQDLAANIKLHALTLISDCNKYKMDLATGSAICNEAINFVSQRKEQLNKLETMQKIDERIEEMKEEEEEKTNSGIF